MSDTREHPEKADTRKADPTPSGHPGNTKTTTAGESGNAIVIRPDDPDATPVPAGDLDPATVVIPADTEKVPPAEPVYLTNAEIAEVLDDADAPAALKRAGLRVVRA